MQAFKGFPGATLQGPFQEEPIILPQLGSFTRAGRVEQPGAPEDVPSDPCSACSEDVFITFTGYLSSLHGSSPYRALCFFLFLKAANPTISHGSVAPIRAVHCDAAGR